jgi:hypothetical protein
MDCSLISRHSRTVTVSILPSIGHHLRDALLAVLMTNNDRIPASAVDPILVLREDSELLA